jgi:hypothetical protein
MKKHLKTMNSHIRTVLIVVSVLLMIGIADSCKKESSKTYSHYVSEQLVLTYSTTYINNLISTASVAYPDLGSIRNKFTNAVKVSKLVYNTTIGGKTTRASGLLCLPDFPGEYPVICFQNGTNTINSFAPSNLATYTSYQMIEVLASLGFIVVIPDYPGFGESSQIPHPYLVSEPTVTSIVDMLSAVNEALPAESPDIILKNEYYLMGYSQGGWATMALHKALETKYSSDFNLKGSICGAGPYDIKYLMQSMIGVQDYSMPVYIGYIINAYKAYNQFDNPVSDILNEPYATRLSSLYTGLLTSDQINSQLTTSMSGLLTTVFLNGFSGSAKYSSFRSALTNNSISPWHTYKTLYMLHGGSDTQVNPAVTNYFYDAMISAGTSASVCTKEILPGLDHGDGAVPCMIKGIQLILSQSGR